MDALDGLFFGGVLAVFAVFHALDGGVELVHDIFFGADLLGELDDVLEHRFGLGAHGVLEREAEPVEVKFGRVLAFLAGEGFAVAVFPIAHFCGLVISAVELGFFHGFLPKGSSGGAGGGGGHDFGVGVLLPCFDADFVLLADGFEGFEQLARIHGWRVLCLGDAERGERHDGGEKAKFHIGEIIK